MAYSIISAIKPPELQDDDELNNSTVWLENIKCYKIILKGQEG